MADIDWRFRDVCIRSGRPLYHRMVDVQECIYNAGEKQMEMRYVERVDERRTFGNTETTELRFVPAPRGYIAVSCPWELPQSETRFGKYCFEEEPAHHVEYPQDLVLDRVIKFAEKADYPVWIDKLCVDQEEGSPEKSTAIQSMDLVYKNSEITLGLLFVRLDLEMQVRHLEHLLRGDYITCVAEADGNIIFSLVIDDEEACEVLGVVELIVQDNWWERAWIFQEEYLSALRMLLLIRTSQDPEDVPYEFGDISGELQVVATNFRSQVTTFCLAFLQSSSISGDHRGRSLDILWRAGKYNILAGQRGFAGTFRAMSPIIFKDIGKRDVKYVWDKIAIACNCCEYPKRLDTLKLQQQQQEDTWSVSLAILTMYIINGEVLRHDLSWAESSEGDIFDFLTANTLDVQPPVEGEKELTFKKHCRLPDVRLFEFGIVTEGVIWKLSKQLPFELQDHSAPVWSHRYNMKDGTQGIADDRNILGTGDLEALWYLVHWLQHGTHRSYETLAQKLTAFLSDTARYDGNWTRRHLMSMMALSVARAVRGEGWLILACDALSSSYSPYSAIFVSDAPPEHDELSFAFTSWRPQSASVVRNAIYTSLEIEALGMYKERLAMKPKRWINGLCFFSDRNVREVVIPWPDLMTASRV